MDTRSWVLLAGLVLLGVGFALYRFWGYSPKTCVCVPTQTPDKQKEAKMYKTVGGVLLLASFALFLYLVLTMNMKASMCGGGSAYRATMCGGGGPYRY